MSEEAPITVAQIVAAIVVVGVLIIAMLYIIFDGKIIRGSCRTLVYILYTVSMQTGFGAQAALQTGLASCDTWQF